MANQIEIIQGNAGGTINRNGEGFHAVPMVNTRAGIDHADVCSGGKSFKTEAGARRFVARHIERMGY